MNNSSGKNQKISTRLSRIFLLVSFLLTINLIIPQLGQLRSVLGIFTVGNLGWLILAFMLQSLTYMASAYSLFSVVDVKLPFLLTSLEQLAGTFLNIFTIQGLGRINLDINYLEKAGIEKEKAISAVLLEYAGNIVLRFLFTIIFGLFLGWSLSSRLPAFLKGGFSQKFLYFVSGVLIFILIGFLINRNFFKNKNPLPSLRNFVSFGNKNPSPSLRNFVFFKNKIIFPIARILKNGRLLIDMMISKPSKGFQFVFGNLSGIFVDALTLKICLYAFSSNISLVNILAVLLGSVALSSFSPTPGGLGVVELSLVLGFTALGIHYGQAVSAVMVFRLLSFWLPIVPGYIVFLYFRRKNII